MAGSAGSPTRIAAARSPMAVDELVVDRALDEDREPAVQRSPLSENTPNSALSRAASTSASANTMHGDLPPSSIDRPFRWSAAERMMILPVVVSPVNEITGHVGMGDERGAGLLADAVHDVEHARRDARPPP